MSGVLTNFAKFIGQTCARVSILIKLQALGNFIKKETLAQIFSSEFFENSKNIFFDRTPSVAASEFKVITIYSEIVIS